MSIAIEASQRLPINIFNPGGVRSEVVEKLSNGLRHRISFEKSSYVIDARVERIPERLMSSGESLPSALTVDLRIENARRGFGADNLRIDEGYLRAAMASNGGPHVGSEYLHISIANSIPAGVPGYQGPMAGQHLYAALRHLYPDHPFLGKVTSMQIRRGLLSGFKRSLIENNFTHSTLSGAPGPIRFLKYADSPSRFTVRGPLDILNGGAVGLLRLPGSADEPIRWMDRSKFLREDPAGYSKALFRAYTRGISYRP